MWFWFSVLASLGQHLVLLGSRFLWVPHNTFCAFAFLSWLLWDSFWFVREPASLGPSPLLCAFVLYCPGFSMTVFLWVLTYPGPFRFLSRCMIWLISMHHLTVWHWYHSLNASQKHLQLLPPGSFGSFCLARVPASLGPSPSVVWFCFFVLASLGQHLVLLGSRLLWVSPNPLCAFDFLSWPLWYSFCFVSVLASLDPSPNSVLLCFTVPAPLRQAFAGPGLSGSLPLFSRDAWFG